MVTADETHALWCARVAEAARAAAAEIDPLRQPSLRHLHADLVELADRLEAEAGHADPSASSP